MLQKHVKSELGHELKLILGCKTHWNSLFDMVERFVKLTKCIKMALIQVQSPITISDSELLVLKDLVKVLKPVKLGTKALCRQKSAVKSLAKDLLLRLLPQAIKEDCTENTNNYF